MRPAYASDAALPDDPAADPATGVAGWVLGRHVVLPGVDDDAPPGNRVGTGRDVQHRGVDFHVAVAIGAHGHVAEVARVVFPGVRRAVGHAGRVEVAAGRRSVGRGTVALLVQVDGVQTRRGAGHVDDDVHSAAHLGEGSRAGEG